MVDFATALQEATRYMVPTFLTLAGYVVWQCPCDIVPLCHYVEFHTLVGYAVMLVNVNVFTQLGTRVVASQRMPLIDKDGVVLYDEDSNAGSDDDEVENSDDYAIDEQDEEEKEAAGVGSGAVDTA